MWDWTWMWRVTKSKPSSSLPSPSSSPSLKLSSITNQPSTREHHPENIQFWFLYKVSLCLSASTKLQTIRHLPLESWFATGLLRELCLVNTYQLGRHLPHCLTLEHCLDRRNVIFLLCSCCLKSLVQYITSFIYTYIYKIFIVQYCQKLFVQGCKLYQKPWFVCCFIKCIFSRQI